MAAYQSLPYFGGKEGRVGDWIASLLPYRHCFIEPFGGMGKITLKRQPSRIEIINDRDEDIITWWRVVRDDDKRAALIERLRCTPHSRAEFYRARRDIDDRGRDDVTRALDVTILLNQSYQHSLRLHRTGWRRSFTTPINTHAARITARLEALAERIINVQFECIHANELLARTRDVADAVIYCDPPYDKAARYKHHLDAGERRAFVALLKRQAGVVAVSGHPGEWDALGWPCFEFSVKTAMVKQAGLKDRTEVLWVNRQPAETNDLFEGTGT